MSEQHTRQLAERLLAIDWYSDLDHAQSRVNLMREYLRRAAWWAQRLDTTAYWPFFDIAARVDPTVRADLGIVAAVDRALMSRTVAQLAVWSCERALHWAALRDSGALDGVGVPDPYEPLIVLFERGGGFAEEHGFVQVDMAGIPLRTLNDHLFPEPVVDPSDTAALDELDGIF